MIIVKKEIIKTQGYEGPLGLTRRSSIAYAEYDYILGKNLGESIRNAVAGVTEVPSNKSGLIN